jgi:hypothetical protein
MNAIANTPPLPSPSLHQSIEPIKAWSYSALKLFEACPFAAKKTYIDREPGLPPPIDTAETAGDRGSRIHEAAELFVRGDSDDLPRELKSLEAKYEYLREEYAAGRVRVEEEWGFDRGLNEVPWMDPTVWWRVKLDALLFHDAANATVIDLKTGKRYGNEVPHNRQGQLYAAAAFIRFPALENVNVEFWYADQKGLVIQKYYDRIKALGYMERFVTKALYMTSTHDFPAKPNVMNCRYCAYGTLNGTGTCPYATEPRR